MTLNMVRPSRINPRLSAYNQIHGIFNYEKTPLAPPGCQVIVHERPQERRTWADHGVTGFYIGPAMHHFRNYYSYIPTTRGVRVSNTVEFFPAHVDMPQTSSEDRLAQVTQDLITVLNNPHLPTPFLHQGEKTNDAIRTLQKIFQPPQQADNGTPVSSPRVQETPHIAPRVLQLDTMRRQSPRVAEQLEKVRQRVSMSQPLTDHNSNPKTYAQACTPVYKLSSNSQPRTDHNLNPKAYAQACTPALKLSYTKLRQIAANHPSKC